MKKSNNKNSCINMYDPCRDFNNHKKSYMKKIKQVISHGRFINGPEVKELEEKLANYVGISHCIGVANGTDALQIALMALDVGIDDEVITVCHTWISTAEVISILGAKPVFVDIEDETFCIDSTKIEKAITDKTKAIIVVSLYGQMPHYNKINDIASKHNIPVIEDAAQSFGAKQNSRRSCSLTTISTTSFFPTKPLGCYGDGGACFTDSKDIAQKIRAIRNHGALKKFNHTYIGMNSRLDSLQAGILLVKFDNLEECLKQRNQTADYYTTNLKQIEENGMIKLPVTLKSNYHVWAQYSILLPNKEIRDKAVSMLKEKGINVSIFYPSPLHTQKCFEYLGYKQGDFPKTEEVCSRIINLPCYAEITKEELSHICSAFTDILYKLIK